MTRVVNVHTAWDFDVYCGRPVGHKTKRACAQQGRSTAINYGNPFAGPDREANIARYAAWLRGEVTHPYFEPPSLEQIRRELKGKVLACHCKPRTCHADVLAHVAEGGEPAWPLP